MSPNSKADQSEFTDRIISSATTSVREFVKPAKQYIAPREIIARYVAAVAVNFTDWLGKTYPWARSPLAQFALMDNIACEQEHDHVGMLLSFAEQAGVEAAAKDYRHVAESVNRIREIMKDLPNAGLAGLTILAVLENTSEVFIPVLEEMGFDLGVTNLKYTKVHGEADAEHSEAFVAALKAERKMDYGDPSAIMQEAADAAVAYLRSIFTE